LLNVLAGRTTLGAVGGSIAVNGVRCKNIREIPHTGSPFFAYVMQDDAFNSMLTVRETLMFAAMIRMRCISPERVSKTVDETLDLLGLKDYADHFINVPEKRTLSNGQLRRLTIGVEIVTAPALIFLDEPTSGLDSYLASKVVESLVTLAAAGHTIICTIHQPSASVFAKFHLLLLLSQGRLLYNGATANCATFFSSLGFDRQPFTNEADFAIYVCQEHAGGDSRLVSLATDPGTEEIGDVVSTHIERRNEGLFWSCIDGLIDIWLNLMMDMEIMYILVQRDTVAMWRRREFLFFATIRAAFMGVVIGKSLCKLLN
jgi:ABC-type multidrug transport system ATPase subunit